MTYFQIQHVFGAIFLTCLIVEIELELD